MIDYVKKLTKIPQNVLYELIDISVEKKISAGEVLIRGNDKSNKEIFIKKGIIKAYFIDEAGNEKVVAFYKGESFIGTNSLRTQKGLSIYTYQCLTDAEYTEIDSDLFHKLVKKYPILLTLAVIVKNMEVERQNKREICIMGNSGEEKYNNFLKFHSDLVDSIPHYNIASYLGITPVTLSRVRKK